MIKYFKKENILLGCIAFLFVSFFSYTTSPIYQCLGNTPDSPIFQIIGKYWLEGSVPYRDLWDLKGPFIFFINALGYAITGSRYGVYLIQIISLFFTLLVLFRIFKLRFSSICAYFMIFISTAGLAYVYEGGNLTEEYILFPLTLSFYYVLIWIRQIETNNCIKHNPIWAFVYGVVFGLALMSRLTNALSLLGVVVVIATMLLYRKEFKNFIDNIVAFGVGFVCIVAPFVCYFAYKDSLCEMWNATFYYALIYAGNAHNGSLLYDIHYFVLSYFNCILMLFIVLYGYFVNRIQRIKVVLYICSAAFPFIWFVQGNGFGHYGMIVFPLFALSMLEINQLKMKKTFISVIIILITGCLSKVKFMFEMYSWNNQEVIDSSDFLKQYPYIDYSSFVAYNCDPNIYLELNIKPSNAFFSLQDFAIERNPLLRDIVISSYKNNKPQWIFLKCEETKTVYIQDVINENYSLIARDKQKQFNLYQYNGN